MRHLESLCRELQKHTEAIRAQNKAGRERDKPKDKAGKTLVEVSFPDNVEKGNRAAPTKIANTEYNIRFVGEVGCGYLSSSHATSLRMSSQPLTEQRFQSISGDEPF